MTPTFHTTPGGSHVGTQRGYATVSILDQPEVPCAVVRAHALALAHMHEFTEPIHAALPDALQRAGYTITAPAFTAYFRFSGTSEATTSVDIACGVPIDRPLRAPLTLSSPDHLVESWSIPGGRIAALSHTGPDSALSTTWHELIRSLAARGLEPVPPLWEVYVQRPDDATNPGPHRTDLFVSLTSALRDN